jgi:hypothetical protein
MALFDFSPHPFWYGKGKFTRIENSSAIIEVDANTGSPVPAYILPLDPPLNNYGAKDKDIYCDSSGNSYEYDAAFASWVLTGPSMPRPNKVQAHAYAVAHSFAGAGGGGGGSSDYDPNLIMKTTVSKASVGDGTEMPDISTLDFFRPKKTNNCDCGAWATGSPGHSTWCHEFKRETL